MGQVRYYEAIGETKKKLAALMEKRGQGFAALKAWAKSHGGKLATADNWSLMAVLVLPDGVTPKDPKNWRNHRSKSHWVPRLSTKIGKQRHEELYKLAQSVPSAIDFGTAIKLPFMGSVGEGLHTYTPGVKQVGDRILIAHTHPTWEPPKGVTLKRISDLQYEKLAGKEKS